MRLDLDFLKKNIPLKMEYFDSIDSTSLYLNRLIKEGAKVPDLVLAGVQTNGQGRVGRSFYSPEKTGLYLTFAIPTEKVFCDDITPRVALCVATAIDEVFETNTGIKWVNDIYLNGKKVSGVLCQRVDQYYLIGIGINVEEPKFVPEDLSHRFGSITNSCDPILYTKLVIALYQNLWSCFNQSKEEVLNLFREKCVHIGAVVQVEYDQKMLQGICLGIDDDFSLLLDIDGKVKTIKSGYMSLKI